MATKNVRQLIFPGLSVDVFVGHGNEDSHLSRVLKYNKNKLE
jgi:hypothetical protein